MGYISNETNGLTVSNLLVPARGFWQHHNDTNRNAVSLQKQKYRIFAVYSTVIFSLTRLYWISVHFNDYELHNKQTKIGNPHSMIDKAFVFFSLLVSFLFVVFLSSYTLWSVLIIHSALFSRIVTAGGSFG